MDLFVGLTIQYTRNSNTNFLVLTDHNKKKHRTITLLKNTLTTVGINHLVQQGHTQLAPAQP
jgi:hypothetical protein